MKKFVKLVFAAMLVLLAITACSPRGGYPFVPPIGENDGKPTVSNPDDFEEAIANGEDIVLPSGKTFILPQSAIDSGKALNITGTGTGEDVSTLNIPVSPEEAGNDGEYTLPAGSSLKNVKIVFTAENQIKALSAEGEPKVDNPPFAMLITGSTTLDGVTFVFPDDGSLSGICIWNASGVSISNVSFIGKPARAPFNISGSTVEFSGSITAPDGSSWYEGKNVIQINGVGSNHQPSNVSFNNVTGIDAVWQEVIEPTYGTAAVYYDNPFGSSVTGLDDCYFIFADRGDTRGWMWLVSDDLASQVLPLFFALPAHDRFFNTLNGEGSYASLMKVSERPSSLDDLTYTISPDGYYYSTLGMLTATGTDINVKFSDISNAENGVTASRWSMTGDVELTLTIPATMLDPSATGNISAKILVSMDNFAGIFSDSSQGTEAKNPAKFEMNDDKVVAVVAPKDDEEGVKNNAAFSLAAGLTGSLSINGVAVDLDEFMALASAFEMPSLGQ